METLAMSFPSIEKIDIVAEVEPSSVFSIAYKKSITLLPEDELSVILKCPNGSCTNGAYVFDPYILKKTINHALASGVTETIVGYCNGWEDEERIGNYHCNSKFTLKVSVHRRSP